MSIELGHAYEFRFKTGFESLNGIYRVTHALSYDSILEAEADLLTNLYAPAGKDQDDLDTDLPVISKDSFYTLVSPADASVLYMPSRYIVGIPIPDVREYAKLMLNIDLGVISDPALLQSITDSIAQILQGAHGIVSPPVVMQYDTEWMSESTYDAIVTAREASKTGIQNYYTLSLEQAVTIAEKNAKIAALETLVDQLYAQLP